MSFEVSMLLIGSDFQKDFTILERAIQDIYFHFVIHNKKCAQMSYLTLSTKMKDFF